jgi:AhpD family alkylhydroperoxidase
MKITWFGHSTFRLDFADNVVLIDPLFTDNPAFHGSLDQAIGGATHILITLRVSQIDDCAYCLDMHTRDLLRKGQNIEKIALVQARAEAVLAWTETVTLVAETSMPDEAYAAAHIVFEEREVLDLTIAIGVMNTY